MDEIICNISNSYIKYIINDNVCQINNMYINYDEFKLFAKLLNKFCDNMEQKKIKKITQLAPNENDDNNDFYSKFDDVRIINDKIVELISNPINFKFAVLKALNIQI